MHPNRFCHLYNIYAEKCTLNVRINRQALNKFIARVNEAVRKKATRRMLFPRNWTATGTRRRLGSSQEWYAERLHPLLTVLTTDGTGQMRIFDTSDERLTEEQINV